MKKAMWKTDDSGMFSFSDASFNPSQATLFENEPNTNELKKLLLDKFKGKKVTIEDLERFVIINTPYLISHLRKPILIPMEKANPPEINVEKRTRKGSYPENCIIEFL
jgi:hypothetical protein